MKRWIIVGAGGFGREVYAWLTDAIADREDEHIAGFLDDDPAALSEFDFPVPVLSRIAGYSPEPNDALVCAVGRPDLKRDICGKLLKLKANFESLIHPSAIIGPSVELGTGVVICPRVTLTTNIRIGDFVGINCHSSIGHDAEVGDWTTISGHCDITGGVKIGRSVFLGSGASIMPGKMVGDNALVGVGAVVIKAVAPDKKVFGNPARTFV